ncbi:MAG TPA: FAD-binding oxidoreductase, partial [Ferruginibacter sp.]|nr:FAD-binding oxidoreductase [Ferruginibacter sp.]
MKLMPAISSTNYNLHIHAFQSIVGKNFVFNDELTLNNYAQDQTEDLHFPPDIVIKPKTTEEIAAIMKICNAHKIPVTPRGAGTGLSGGALPQFGGILLSTERLNTILHIDEQNLQVTTEPGVITEVLQDAVKEKG